MSYQWNSHGLQDKTDNESQLGDSAAPVIFFQFLFSFFNVFVTSIALSLA